MRRTLHALMGCALGFALAACWTRDTHGDEPGAGGANGDSAGVAGAHDPFAAGSGAAAGAAEPSSAFAVEVRAEDATLCPGECTTLVAEAVNGTPPYTYIWNHASLVGGGPVEICPTNTTTYEVTVEDSASTIEEFAQDNRTAMDELHVFVTEDCATSDDAGLPDPIDVPPGQPICELRIPFGIGASFSPFTSSGGHSNVSVDAAGNAYFVASFNGGTIPIGDMSIVGTSNTQGVIVKLSPACKPLWIKELRTSQGSMAMTSLAVSASGDELYAAGILTGVASFGGESFDTSGQEAGVLLKLDAAGEVLWAKATTATTTARIYDVALASDGGVIASGLGPDGTRFAGLGFDVRSESFMAFVARLRPDGSAVFLHAMDYSAEDLTVAVLPSGSAALMGWGPGIARFTIAGGEVEAPPEQWALFIVLLDARGDFLWGKTVRSSSENWTTFLPTSMTIDRRGNILLDESHYLTPPSGTVISTPPELIRIDEAGNEVWSRQRPYPRSSENLWSGAIAVDSGENILVLDQLWDGAANETGGAFATLGMTDFALNKRTHEGEPIWLWQSGGPHLDWCWGLAVDAADAIWVGSGSSNLDAGGGEIVLTRLAP